MRTNSPIGIETTLEEVAEHNRQAIVKLDSRLAEFLTHYNNEFQLDIIPRINVDVITWGLFQTTLSLYANGNNSSVIVELHSILEKLSILDLPKILTENKISQTIIKDIIERKNLTDLAPFYERVGIWSSEDVSFVRHLSRVRNGIAHKNEELISKALNGGKEIHFLDINLIVDNHEIIDYIIKSIKLYVKLFEYFR